MEAAENSVRETAALRVRVGSLHFPPSGTRLPLRPSCFRLEAEEREVTVLASELEAAAEEEVKVEDHWILFRPCRWINCPFTRLRVLTKGVEAVAAAASEAEDGCVPGGTVVGGEVGSGGVCRHCNFDLVQASGGDTFI